MVRLIKDAPLQETVRLLPLFSDNVPLFVPAPSSLILKRLRYKKLKSSFLLSLQTNTEIRITVSSCRLSLSLFIKNGKNPPGRNLPIRFSGTAHICRGARLFYKAILSERLKSGHIQLKSTGTEQICHNSLAGGNFRSDLDLFIQIMAKRNDMLAEAPCHGLQILSGILRICFRKPCHQLIH